MAIRTLTFIQNNVVHWLINFLSLLNTYRTKDPDIILINSHGNSNENKIEVSNYNIIQTNSTGEGNDGCAICINKTISCQQIESLSLDITAIRIPLEHEQLTITTFYSPPRKENLPI